VNRKPLLSWILNVLFILSLLFIIIYLFRLEWLGVPVVYSMLSLIVSVLLLLVGFMVDSRAWMVIVSPGIPTITYRDAFVSSGKYIFAKYIPGKLWIIFGKAGYLKNRYKASLIILSSYAIVYHVFGIFTAILLSLGATSVINMTLFYFLLIPIVFSIILMAFFQRPSFKIFSSLISWLLRRNITIPALSSIIILKSFFLSLLTWVVWSLAFFLFIKAIFVPGAVLTFNFGLVFPMSAIMGMIVLIAPGGLGVREGFLALGLTALGMPTKEAATIAMFSRVWFMLGELLIFSISIFLSNQKSFNE